MVKSAKGGSADAPQKAAANAVHKQSTKKSGATSKGGTGTAASPEKRKQAAAPATSAAAVPSSGGEIDDLFGKLKGKGKAAAAAAEATKTAAAAAAAGATPAVDAKLAAKVRRELSPPRWWLSPQTSMLLASSRAASHPPATAPINRFQQQARPKRVEGSKDDIFGTEQAEARK